MKRVILTLYVLCLLAAVAEPPFVVPLDLGTHTTAEPSPQLKALDDEAYEWTLPQGAAETLLFDLDAQGIDPAHYDEIRFEIKSTVSQVRTHWMLHGHLDTGQVSSWYLKFKTPEGEWREGRYSLHLDDDGVYISKDTNPEAYPRWLKITLSPRILGYPGEPKRREALIRNVRFVRHRVAADFELDDAEIIADAAEVATVYQLHLTNRTDQPQTVSLNADSAGKLHYFRADAPATVELAPKEKQIIPVRLSMPRHAAMARAPLYSEAALVQVSLPGVEDADVIPLRGYRQWPMWASVPLFNYQTWNPTTFQARLRARETLIPGIGQWRDSVLKHAETALEHDWPIPDFGPPEHNMRYRCKTCKNWLKPVTPTSLHKHHCPTCGKVFDHDERMDRAYLLNYHQARADHIRDLALAWLLTGDERFAAKAATMLLNYAEGYPKMPTRGTRSTAGGARLGWATLHASYAIPVFAEGYYYLREAPVIDDVSRQAIEAFLRHAGRTVVQHSVEYGNQQSEHIRAYGTVGLATQFWPLAAEAIHGEFGYHEVIEYGFSEDGIAPEAGAYHRASFGALAHLAAFAWSQGLNLYTPRFKRVFDGSIAAGLASTTSYELPYRVYRDPAYLQQLPSRDGKVQTDTVLHGLIGLPNAEEMPVRSAHLTGAGYIFLKRGHAGDYREIRLNYLKQFDRAEHDRLTTFFFRNGRQIDSTVGRIAYSAPNNHWMYHPAAHNCIVIDGQTQQADRGRLIAFEPSPETPLAVVASDPERPFYPGVSQLRCMALLGDAYIVFDHIQSDQPRTIDRYQYGKGRPTLLIDGEAELDSLPAIPEAGEFQQLQGGAAGRELRVDFANNLRLRLVADGDMSAYRAITHGGFQARPMDVTFARLADTHTATFLAAFTDEADAQPPSLKILRTDPANLAFEVRTEATAWIVEIRPDARQVSVGAE